MKKFLLVDDHDIVRSGIKGLLTELFKPCEIFEAQDSDSATQKLKEGKYDLIMMDIRMPNSDTLGLMEYIHIRYPGTKVLIFSMSAENVYAKRYLKAGAMGFITKDAPMEEIKKAINTILSNKRYISESMAEFLAAGSISNSPDNPFEKLSRREFEITHLLLSGSTVSEISKSLNLQTSTVGTHKSRVFEKLAVSNLLELKELANSYNI